MVKARPICGIYPVRRERLNHARSDVDIAGAWGGTRALERRMLRSVA
jgi:hypothetical protein